jgi:antitoxin component HigA of HigAB toxin-antitoxin module
MVLTIDEKLYGRLLAKALPAVIRNEEENEKTLLRIEALMDKGYNRNPEEDRLLELLARLAADFEAANYDFGASKPNEVLSFLLDKRGLKQVDLLPVLGCSKGGLSDMLSGRREIARGTAKKLAEFFRLPVDLFI